MYRDGNLKTEVRPEVHMVPKPTWKDRTNFPCHEMTALEIQSIVASCKYSNWQCIIKDKTQKNHWLLECHKASCAKSGKQAKYLFGDWCCSRLQEAWSFRLLDPKAWEQTSSPRRILMHYQKHGSYGLQGVNKGTNRLSEKICLCCERK